MSFPAKWATVVDPMTVYLNVYDLNSINGYAYWLGLGMFHSGVQVHGVEYAYGAHEEATAGIFEVDPRQCPGFRYRKSIMIGRTAMTAPEITNLIEAMEEQYAGNAYNLITKNCNHFCDDVCQRLTGNSIPRWVNRLARIGSMCHCVLPEGVNVEMLKAAQREAEEEKKKKEERSQRKLKKISSKGANNTPATGAADAKVVASGSTDENINASAAAAVAGDPKSNASPATIATTSGLRRGISWKRCRWRRKASSTALVGVVSTLEV